MADLIARGMANSNSTQISDLSAHFGTDDKLKPDRLPVTSGDIASITETIPGNNLYVHATRLGNVTLGGNPLTEVSNKIACLAGRHYKCNVASNYHLAWFDAVGDFVSESVVAYTSDIVPAADGYFAFGSSSETSICVEGTNLNAVHAAQTILDSTSIPKLSGWYGKTWYHDGDSISSDNGDIATRPFASLVSEALGMTVTNVAASGETMIAANSRIETSATHYDLITVMMGANDEGYNCAIGSLADAADNDGSFYARCKYMAQKMHERYPTKVCAFFTPIRRALPDQAGDTTYHTNVLSKTTLDYAEVIKAVAEEYGIPCLDLSGCIDPRYVAIRSQYFLSTADGTHPNNLGHAKYIAPVVKAFLESICPFTAST